MSPALQGMLLYNQFILYKLQPSQKRAGKTDKLPVNPATMKVANAHDKTIWKSHAEIESIRTALNDDTYGIGFVFTYEDPFFFLDIDNCGNEDGSWSDLALSLMNCLPNAAVEVSQSGTGLHIFGMTHPKEHGCKNAEHGLELYTGERFAALTDIGTSGDCTTDCTQLLDQIIAYYFPVPVAKVGEEWRDTPVPEWNGLESDDELIIKACKSKSVASTFGNKASFEDLWNNNVPALAITYPPLNDTDPYDRSSADAALAQNLAFWTGKNHERMLRLMKLSFLGRDKWTLHKSYLTTTISSAVAYQGDVYGKRDTPDTETPAIMGTIAPTQDMDVPAASLSGGVGGGFVLGTPVQKTGFQLITTAQQPTFFDKHCYVQREQKIITPDGVMHKHEQYRVVYGGYNFAMDNDGTKTTDDAWKCFCESQALDFPKVNHLCFRPELPPMEIVEEESSRMVNSYVPANVKSVQGDVSLFTTHVRNLVNNDEEYEMLMGYMAACVQHVGVKFQWCPVVQGTEGNGKSFLGTAMANSIGNKYTHVATASELGSGGTKFNGWLANKLLVIIEEIYTSDRREVSESLKAYITNPKIEIQSKGQDQYTGDNRANFIMFTNHKDAISITHDGRRYAIIYCKQQSKVDLERQGMNTAYFNALYGWAERGGYANIAHFLQTYDIKKGHNPATDCKTAPLTNATHEAIELSKDNVQAEIEEQVANDVIGFKYPWISLEILKTFMKENNLDRFQTHKTRKMKLNAMGYIRHPALNKGRMDNPIPFEKKKPTLYVKEGTPESMIVEKNEVRMKYIESQGYSASDAIVGFDAGVVVPMPKQG